METVLISGPKRSGTHLLYRLLDGHPALFNALAETYYLEYVDQVEESSVQCLLDHLVEADTNVLFEQIRERALLPLFDDDADYPEPVSQDHDMHVTIDQDELQSQFGETRGDSERTVEGLWNAWFRALQGVATSADDPHPVVFKCADYGPSARSAAEYLDDRKILFIVRNPVFTFSSLRKLRNKESGAREFTTLRLIEEISRYQRFEATRVALAERSDVATHTVRFEDLVLNTESCLREICSFLGVEFRDAVTRPTFLDRSWKGDSSYDSYEGVSVEPLDPDRINLTDRERALVADGLSDVLSRFDYDVTPEPPVTLS